MRKKDRFSLDYYVILLEHDVGSFVHIVMRGDA